MVDAGGSVNTEVAVADWSSLDGYEVIETQLADDVEDEPGSINGLILPAFAVSPANLARTIRLLREIIRRGGRAARAARRLLDELENQPGGQKPIKGRRRRGVNPTIKEAISALLRANGNVHLALSALGYDP